MMGSPAYPATAQIAGCYDKRCCVARGQQEYSKKFVQKEKAGKGGIRSIVKERKTQRGKGTV